MSRVSHRLDSCSHRVKIKHPDRYYLKTCPREDAESLAESRPTETETTSKQQYIPSTTILATKFLSDDGTFML